MKRGKNEYVRTIDAFITLINYKKRHKHLLIALLCYNCDTKRYIKLFVIAFVYAPFNNVTGTCRMMMYFIWNFRVPRECCQPIKIMISNETNM